jgi:hypothetical protein
MDMKSFSFTVRSNKKSETTELEQTRVLIGSGAHCDIRLAPETAAWEHLVVTLEGESEERTVVRVIPRDVVVFREGTPFREAMLEPGDTIQLEGATLTYAELPRAAANPARREAGKGTSPLAYAGILVILIGLAALYAKKNDASYAAPETVPEPLAARIEACPVAEPARGLALATEKAQLGAAKRQRWMFYPRDGVEAVSLFEIAAACFRAGGDTPRAREAKRAAETLRAGVEEEFRVYRVQLDRALARSDSRVALAQIRLLRDMLFGRELDDEYVRWLTIMQRKLEAKASRDS